MKDWKRERARLDKTKESLEADAALSRKKLRSSHLEVCLCLSLCRCVRAITKLYIPDQLFFFPFLCLSVCSKQRSMNDSDETKMAEQKHQCTCKQVWQLVKSDLC